MKRCLLVLVFIGIGIVTQAQTWAEWFSQKSTQKKYLIQQIAMLQVYIGYLQKGYKIAKNGLTTIGNIKNGHFSLDKDFFASLHNINPKVKQYAKVADIITLNKQIRQISERTKKYANDNSLLSGNETIYLNHVFEELIDGCGNLTDQLIAIITSGKLEMSDDERIKQIDFIYEGMRERYMFANSFESDLKILVQQRKREQSDVNMLNSLNGNVR